jgi:pyruvate,water dikinase
MESLVVPFAQLRRSDTAIAGGKGANLGELVHAGLPVPPGFVLTARAYEAFVDHASLQGTFAEALTGLDIESQQALQLASEAVQAAIGAAPMPAFIHDDLVRAYRELSGPDAKEGVLVAVRSSATIEDLASASFAGMNRSFLNVRGAEDVVQRVKDVWASLFSPRAIYYRAGMQLAVEPQIAVIVEKMVNAATSGVGFSIDPARGDPTTIVIEGAFGLGEVVVGGEVEPDHYEVDKASLAIRRVHPGKKTFMLTRNAQGQNTRVDLTPERAAARVLTDEQVKAVAELIRRDEQYYGCPQDVEWAIEDGQIYLVQSRPVTAGKAAALIPQVSSSTQPAGAPLVRGLSASPGRVSGRTRIVRSVEDGRLLQQGEILVAATTSPDWVPFMRRAAAVVTEAGGTTSHAAIVTREMGLPCIVGAEGAMTALADGSIITVDATAGSVFAGGSVSQPSAAARAGPAGPTSGQARAVTATELLVNLAEPDLAERVAAGDVDGVGLLRAEFMLLSALQGTHPRRLLEEGRGQEFVERMGEGLKTIARAFSPRPVVYRSTDFRTNEFRGLAGGEQYEPHEENPMIGVRGASRYVKNPDLFLQELEVLRRVRAEYPNVYLMIPFVRTGSEVTACVRLVEQSGLMAERGFQLWVMAEVPSVVYWLDEYARLGVSGVSIGSNDLTQLVLGVDRDSKDLAAIFDERDPAVVATIAAIIRKGRRLGLHVSICGQAPSVYPEFAEQLVRLGIDSISVNPDAIDRTRRNIAVAEQRLLLEAARQGSEGAGVRPVR